MRDLTLEMGIALARQRAASLSEEEILRRAVHMYFPNAEVTPEIIGLSFDMAMVSGRTAVAEVLLRNA
jgi:hypothetical protein